MFDAQLLKADAAGTVSVYGPWMPRGGDNVICTLDVVAADYQTGSLQVNVFTKAAEDAGDGSSVGGTISNTTGGREDNEWTGVCKDLVRYKFTLSASAENPAWVLFRMLPPIWFDSVDV